MVAVATASATLWAGAANVGGKKHIKFYDANAYIGADLAPALTVDPSDLTAVVAVTTQIYGEILASRPDIRIAALAQEIAAGNVPAQFPAQAAALVPAGRAGFGVFLAGRVAGQQPEPFANAPVGIDEVARTIQQRNSERQTLNVLHINPITNVRCALLIILA